MYISLQKPMIFIVHWQGVLLHKSVPLGCIADIKFIFCGRSLIFLLLPATMPEQNVIMVETGHQSFAAPATLYLFPMFSKNNKANVSV